MNSTDYSQYKPQSGEDDRQKKTHEDAPLDTSLRELDNRVLQPGHGNNPSKLGESLSYQAPTRKVETGSHMLRRGIAQAGNFHSLSPPLPPPHITCTAIP
ncbi:hypothetical protein QLX08_002239 [Tetragonisca angustula]|uniref:Uncharacterized protein n=1 Tax=Tetragonisca angustula TaxID=166442 RepID=A0AAW1ACB1_9HYME